ncbi:MAG: protein phosphatase CheZ [Simplicispira sp.]|nr:protein phosphatase CheZ [Simplicispira sp.]
MTSPAIAGMAPERAFEQLGRITRQLHEAMTELGLDSSLQTITQEIPDARDRLSHVGDMTEAAANKVLNLIDVGQPECRNFKLDSQALTATIDQLRKSHPHCSEEVSDVLATCQMFSVQAEQFATRQNALLSEIMMTQDFQDLSGQIIKKVIDIISLTEKQLLQLLLHSAPQRLGSVVSPKTELAGPQVPDKALKQDDVDDLLASFGF